MFTYQEVYEATKEYFFGNELLTSIWLSKYTLKDKQNNYFELTPDERVKLIAKELTRIEKSFNQIDKERSLDFEENSFYERTYKLLKDFNYFIPAGSILYGVGNSHFLSSLGNCFVIGNDTDSYGSICMIDQEQVQLMKRRGGVGHDLSHLRQKGRPVNGCANTSTGSVSFAPRYSNSTREVAQDGRRGALMLTHHINHPDIEDFIVLKDDTRDVTGANISVKLTDEFMESVINDKNHHFHFPIDDKSTDYGSKSSREIFNKLVHQAWKNGEPGVLFWDKIIKESPADCYPDFHTKSTNPCFSGDTLVAVADGRNAVKIRDLVGTDFLVYSGKKRKTLNNKGTWWSSQIKSARAFKTGKRETIEVFLSDGSSFICTPEHLLATKSGEWVEASKSQDIYLEKFFTFSSKQEKGDYRHIKTLTDGNSCQHRKIWRYYHGEYDGQLFNVDHINCDSTDDRLENLRLLSIEEHKSVTKRGGKDNPIQKIVGTERHRLMNSRKNLYANAKRYNWSQEKLEESLREFDKNNIVPEKSLEKDTYLNGDVFVTKIERRETEDVFDLTVEDNHNFYIITKSDDEKYLNCSGVLVHNCGELPLSPYDSCRLGHINLFAYVKNPFTSSSYFDWEKFESDVQFIQRLMDNIIELEREKVEEIISQVRFSYDDESVKMTELSLWKKVHESLLKGRRTGLGVMGEADMFAGLGFSYDSPEAFEMGVEVHRRLALCSYMSSITLAEERGSFLVFSHKLEENNPFIQRIKSGLTPEWVEKYLKFGRRNISNLTVAPTGTTSQIVNRMGVSSGMEPVFEAFYKRRRKINPNDPQVRVDFVDEVGDKWEEYFVIHPIFEMWAKITHPEILTLKGLTEEKLTELVKESPYNKCTANEIDVISKIKFQGEIQKWVDHSISVTHNLPKTTTEEEISNFIIEAWRSGCKGFTVYREGSRAGVLVREMKRDEESEPFHYIDAQKRPEILNCETHRLLSKGEYWFVLVGLLNSKPYEIFAIKEKKLPSCLRIASSAVLKGQIIKRKKKLYDLITVRPDTGEPIIITDILSLMDSDDDRSDTKRFSLELRHRINPKFISETIDKQPKEITSFEKAITRVLKRYIVDGEVSGLVCDNCGSSNVFYVNGCPKCRDCGISKCG